MFVFEDLFFVLFHFGSLKWGLDRKLWLAWNLPGSPGWLQTLVFLPQTLTCWDYRCTRLHPSWVLLLLLLFFGIFCSVFISIHSLYKLVLLLIMFSNLYITYFNHIYPHPSPCLFLLSVFVNSVNVISVIYRRAVCLQKHGHLSSVYTTIEDESLSPSTINHRSSGRGGASEPAPNHDGMLLIGPILWRSRANQPKLLVSSGLQQPSHAWEPAFHTSPHPSLESCIHSSSLSVGRGNLDEPWCDVRPGIK